MYFRYDALLIPPRREREKRYSSWRSSFSIFRVTSCLYLCRNVVLVCWSTWTRCLWNHQCGIFVFLSPLLTQQHSKRWRVADSRLPTQPPSLWWWCVFFFLNIHLNREAGIQNGRGGRCEKKKRGGSHNNNVGDGYVLSIERNVLYI